MSALCQICSKPAEFTDSTNRQYCGQLCQIKGNLSVILSHPHWNKNMLDKLMNPLTLEERMTLADALLESANARQREWLIEQINQYEENRFFGALGGIVRYSVERNLYHLLLALKAPDFYALDQLKWIVMEQFLSFEMLKVILGKLTNGDMLTHDILIDVLIVYAHTNGDIIRYLLEHYNFSDWVVELLQNTNRNVQIMIANEVPRGVITVYHDESIATFHWMMQKTQKVFKNPLKRIKQ